MHYLIVRDILPDHVGYITWSYKIYYMIIRDALPDCRDILPDHVGYITWSYKIYYLIIRDALPWTAWSYKIYHILPDHMMIDHQSETWVWSWWWRVFLRFLASSRWREQNTTHCLPPSLPSRLQNHLPVTN